MNNRDLPASNRVMGFKTFGCAVHAQVFARKSVGASFSLDWWLSVPRARAGAVRAGL